LFQLVVVAIPRQNLYKSVDVLLNPMRFGFHSNDIVDEAEIRIADPSHQSLEKSNLDFGVTPRW
jgi:hypothetical protein